MPPPITTTSADLGRDGSLSTVLRVGAIASTFLTWLSRSAQHGDPVALWRRRPVESDELESRQRIADGVDDRGKAGDGARFAAAFHPQGVGGATCRIVAE